MTNLDHLRTRTRCKSCLASIFWATTPSGKINPYDFDGVELEEGATGYVIAGSRPPGSRALEMTATQEAGRIAYVSHFTTCPNAASHSKRGRS